LESQKEGRVTKNSYQPCHSPAKSLTKKKDRKRCGGGDKEGTTGLESGLEGTSPPGDSLRSPEARTEKLDEGRSGVASRGGRRHIARKPDMGKANGNLLRFGLREAASLQKYRGPILILRG